MSWCVVVDYGQNMELPFFGQEQAGPTYYYSPVTIPNCEVVNHTHEYRFKDENGNETIKYKSHLHAHMYQEGTTKRKARTVLLRL